MRPTLEILTYIAPGAVQPAHIANLKRLEANAWDGTTAVELAFSIAKGNTFLWEVADTGGSIILTSVGNRGNVRELYLDGLAGDGIIAASPAIVRDLRLIRDEYQCTRIAVTAPRDGWGKFAEELGFKPVSTNYFMEMDDGR